MYFRYVVLINLSQLYVVFQLLLSQFYTSSEEGVLLVRTGNLKGVKILLDEEKYVTKEFHSKNKKSQIFPGDLLLKNFGVTRHGRVIFYDYDEIAKVTECRFRRIPVYNDDDDTRGNTEMITAEANDIFPEEFKAFMAPDGPIGEIFLAEHNEIFDPKYWRDIQKQIEAGEYLRFYAYDKFKRFKIS